MIMLMTIINRIRLLNSFQRKKTDKRGDENAETDDDNVGDYDDHDGEHDDDRGYLRYQPGKNKWPRECDDAWYEKMLPAVLAMPSMVTY